MRFKGPLPVPDLHHPYPETLNMACLPSELPSFRLELQKMSYTEILASKRRPEPASAHQCPAPREPIIVPARQQTLQHPGPSYAPPGLDTFYGYTLSDASMPYHRQQAHVPNVMMPFMPHMQASLPQMLPRAQVTVPPWDPRDVEVSRAPHI